MISQITQRFLMRKFGLNKAGLILSVSHTAVLLGLAYLLVSGVGMDLSGFGDMPVRFLPFGLFIDPVAFLGLVSLSAIPFIGALFRNPVSAVITFLILGGIQWYFIGWFLSVLSRYRRFILSGIILLVLILLFTPWFLILPEKFFLTLFSVPLY